MPPVVFVHGNGDSGALWINNIWRFEANGYKRNQLFAIDFSYPSALSDDAKVQPFRSSTTDAIGWVTWTRQWPAAASATSTPGLRRSGWSPETAARCAFRSIPAWRQFSSR